MNTNKSLAMGLLLLAVMPAQQVFALGAPAGSYIENTATATYTPVGSPPVTIDSNKSKLLVDELIEVTVVSNNSSNILVASPSTEKALSFKVTNTGNGEESFELSFVDTLGGDQFDLVPLKTKIYIDTDDNGIFDPLVDTLYVQGVTANPVFQPDGTLNVFVVGDIPAGLIDNDVGKASLKAESVTTLATVGTDPAGTSFPGMGTGGGNAVVGTSQAEAVNETGFIIASLPTTLEKTASVLDVMGGNKVLPKSIITYTLKFTATGVGTITGVVIDDNIPENTTYVAGSLTYDGVGQSDAVDGDNGEFDIISPNPLVNVGGAIKVNVGDITVAVGAGSVSHTATFKVKVK